MVAVNLLPWRAQRWQHQRRQSGWLLAGLLAFTLAVTLLLAWRNQLTRARLVQAETELSIALSQAEQALAEQKRLLDAIGEWQKNQQRQMRRVSQLQQWQQFWSQLPQLLPDTLWLERLEKRETLLVIQGRAQDMVAVSTFRQQLAAQPLFARIRQGAVQRQSSGDYRFTFQATLQETANE